jgi:LuxR family maltose regulon positive regulatory protein
MLLEALELIIQTRVKVQEEGWRYYYILTLILESQALFTCGKKEVACQRLHEAVHLAEAQRMVRSFIDQGQAMVELLRNCQAQPDVTQGEYFDILLAEFHVQTASPSRLQPEDRKQSWLVDPLSEREIDVLRLLNSSLTGPEIADELIISVNTVRSHIKNIYSKLDAHNRFEAIERAKELGVIK